MEHLEIRPIDRRRGSDKDETVERRNLALPTPIAIRPYDPRNDIQPTQAPDAVMLQARCDGEWCKEVITMTIWSTYYVNEEGKSTTCTTTDYEATTVTSYPTPTPTVPVSTVIATLTSTLSSQPTAAPTASPYIPTQRVVQVDGQHCQCEEAWLKALMGGIPDGTGEVIACIVFFLLFCIFFVCAAARLFRYASSRAIFFILLPFVVFLADMVAFLPTRAYAATHHDTGHILAQHVMFAVAAPILVDVALQLYGLLRNRVEPSGWIDATSMFLRLVNAAALVLYAVAAAMFVSFVNSWQKGTSTCADGQLSRIATLSIVADFLELFSLVIGLICLVWARWRLRMGMAVLWIQAHIFIFLFIFFIWRVAHDIGAASAWSGRQDRTCSPLGDVFTGGHSGATVYFFNYDWASMHQVADSGVNSPAAFWLLAVLPLFLAALILMAVNLVVYTEAVPDLMPMADSARYKLCYNEDTKKMEFVRLDNTGEPRLPTGEPLYEVVRDSSGDGWEIREARIRTVLPAWDNVTMRPWYK